MHSQPHSHTTHTHSIKSQYFADYWNWLDFACNGLMTCCCVLWWFFVVDHIQPFMISLRHNVYENLQAEANFLELKDE